MSAAERTQQLTLLAIRGMDCSVTLADPGLPDCPLVGCSEGFERLSGYSSGEAVGRNCRFLSSGAGLDPRVRARIREAARLGAEFVGVLPNRRKSGEVFSNLFHMTTLRVAGHRYILGIQSDVGRAREERPGADHADLIRSVSERIFSVNFDACVQIEAHEFRVRLPANYSEIMKQLAPDKFEAAQGDFVQVGHRPLREDKLVVRNTFIHIPEEQEGEEHRLRRSASDSLVDHGSGCSVLEEPDFEAPDFEAGGSSASSEGPAGRAAAPAGGAPGRGGALPSVGSAGHPGRCTECRFHFFSLQGCRRGADCRFCHEPHPRPGAGAAAAAAAGRPLRRPLGAAAAAAAAAPGGARAAGAQGAAGAKGGAAGAVRLRYAAGPGVTLARGQPAHLAAELGPGAAGALGPALAAGLAFSVAPALPAGLALDAGTGAIRGAPGEAQERTPYVVTAAAEATGPGGVALGAVAVGEASLSIRVVDLGRYRVSEAADGRCEAGRERLTVTYVALSPTP